MIELDFLERTRRSYDAIADPYAEWIGGLMGASPWDRAALAVFAGRVAGHGAVLDAGCGEGRITRHLRGLGVAARGVDLSPRMIDNARRASPDVSFEVGSITDLEADDRSYAGVVAWYSLIHVPPDLLPVAIGELVRVLVPGGWFLAAFQTDGETYSPAALADVPVSLDFYRPQVETFVALLDAEGLDLESTTVRAADDDLGESTRQAYVLARRRH